jgi:hypothetical protein
MKKQRRVSVLRIDWRLSKRANEKEPQLRAANIIWLLPCMANGRTSIFQVEYKA